jgi:ribonuclease HI
VEAQIQTLTIVGDSSTIIKLMHKKVHPIDYKLTSILVQAQHEAKRIQTISFYQVLRSLNRQVDLLANKETKLKMGELWVNGQLTIQAIP